MEMPKGLEYAHVFIMMNIAFIEIRANDSDAKNYAIANMFHNVPLMMKNRRPIEEIWNELFLQAKRCEVTAYLQMQAEYAIKKLS